MSNEAKQLFICLWRKKNSDWISTVYFTSCFQDWGLQVLCILKISVTRAYPPRLRREETANWPGLRTALERMDCISLAWQGCLYIPSCVSSAFQPVQCKDISAQPCLNEFRSFRWTHHHSIWAFVSDTKTICMGHPTSSQPSYIKLLFFFLMGVQQSIRKKGRFFVV